MRIPLAATFAPSDRARVFRSRVALDARACPAGLREGKENTHPLPTCTHVPARFSAPPPSRDLQTTMNPVQEESQALLPKGATTPASSWVRKAVGGTCVVAGCAVAALAYTGFAPLGVNTLADARASLGSSARTPAKTPPGPRARARILAKTRSYARARVGQTTGVVEKREAPEFEYLKPAEQFKEVGDGGVDGSDFHHQNIFHGYPGFEGCEATCEGDHVTHDMCDSMFYCEWDVGRCWSAVGPQACPANLEELYLIWDEHYADYETGLHHDLEGFPASFENYEYPGTIGCETTCEGVNIDERLCATMFFCEWEDGRCWSAVGPNECPATEHAMHELWYEYEYKHVRPDGIPPTPTPSPAAMYIYPPPAVVEEPQPTPIYVTPIPTPVPEQQLTPEARKNFAGQISPANPNGHPGDEHPDPEEHGGGGAFDHVDEQGHAVDAEGHVAVDAAGHVIPGVDHVDAQGHPVDAQGHVVVDARHSGVFNPGAEHPDPTEHGATPTATPGFDPAHPHPMGPTDHSAASTPLPLVQHVADVAEHASDVDPVELLHNPMGTPTAEQTYAGGVPTPVPTPREWSDGADPEEPHAPIDVHHPEPTASWNDGIEKVVLEANTSPYRHDHFDHEAGYPGTKGCELTCEGHGFDETACTALFFCEFDEGKCWSAVGPHECPNSVKEMEAHWRDYDDDPATSSGDFHKDPDDPLVTQHMPLYKHPSLIGLDGDGAWVGYPGTDGCENACESEDFGEEHCTSMFYCMWQDGKCWSGVGPHPCPETEEEMMEQVQRQRRRR